MHQTRAEEWHHESSSWAQATSGGGDHRGVTWIHLQHRLREMVFFAIGFAGDHHAKDVLDIPTTFHQLDGQPIQQIDVLRLPLKPEVSSAHQPCAKYQLPQMIYQHSCREGQAPRQANLPAPAGFGGSWILPFGEPKAHRVPLAALSDPTRLARAHGLDEVHPLTQHHDFLNLVPRFHFPVVGGELVINTFLLADKESLPQEIVDKDLF